MCEKMEINGVEKLVPNLRDKNQSSYEQTCLSRPSDSRSQQDCNV